MLTALFLHMYCDRNSAVIRTCKRRYCTKNVFSCGWRT